LREDATLHRLWYDLRNQSLFEEALPGRRPVRSTRAWSG